MADAIGERGATSHTPIFAPDADRRAAAMPKVLWIELTSKCPFDCVFCTRRSRWGAGRHMDFAIYESLIRELDRPEFIGLNYSGESIYYPRLLEAIELAAATGAATEIVTAFSTIPPALLRGIVESRLDRLAVSLHTMDAEQYRHLYRLGSLDLLKRRVGELLELRARGGRSTPRLDFCFVALEENLDQLPAVAAYAREVGVREVFVHPIIGRHVTPSLFPRELDGIALRDAFKGGLRQAVRATRERCPEIAVTVLNATVEPEPALGHAPRYFGPALPAGARIHSCDQNPWETVHVLAGGDVVVCEVHDEVSLGRLGERSLADIWRGEGFRDFRRRYSAGLVAECRTCPWKTAYVPEGWRSTVRSTDGPSAQLARGWHGESDRFVVWSKREALLALPARAGGGRLRVQGILPPHPEGNALRVACNGAALGRIVNRGRGFHRFDASLPLPAAAGEALHVTFAVDRTYRPLDVGTGSDTRDLGFGLIEAGLEADRGLWQSPVAAGRGALAALRNLAARVRTTRGAARR
jgi:radical SAM protein with 4Fe4S-binding SPASM domain